MRSRLGMAVVGISLLSNFCFPATAQIASPGLCNQTTAPQPAISTFTSSEPTTLRVGGSNPANQRINNGIAPGAPADEPLSKSMLNQVPTRTSALHEAGTPLKVGIALGGGGARGFAHIGVLRALVHNGVPIDCVAGTSMGSIIGGLFSSGLTPEQIDQVVREKHFGEIFEHVNGTLGLAMLPIAVVPKALASNSYDGLFKGTGFASFIDSKLPPERHNIEQQPLKFTAVAFNLIDGKSFSLQAGDLGMAILASCTLPELRQPVPWLGRLLVDGGVVANLPCRQVKEMGADIVIAVNVDQRMTPVSDAEFKSIGSVSNRCLEANLNILDDDAEKEADFVIHPSVDGIKLLSRSQIDMNRAIMEGDKAATAAMPAILQLLRNHGIALRSIPPSMTVQPAPNAPPRSTASRTWTLQ